MEDNSISGQNQEHEYTNPLTDDSNWVDEPESENIQPKPDNSQNVQKSPLKPRKTLVLVETAFLASAASLIWLINYYFPLGPILRLLFPLPIALINLRWGNRAAGMTTLVCGLLLSVLMGPPRSVVFLIPYGFMGWQLGFLWRRGASWWLSIFVGTLIGTFGFFFRFWLFSILLGENLWLYVITQITALADWIFLKLGLLSVPSLWLIELLALIMIVINNLIYLFAVHLTALLILDRLGNPIPRPPTWVQALLDDY